MKPVDRLKPTDRNGLKIGGGNTAQWLPVPVGFKIVHDYFMAKGQAAAEKYFWRNSVKAYKWVKRTPSQRQA